MTTFRVHDIESAPPAAHPVLASAKAKYGGIPNLIGVLAESPIAAEAYLALGDLFTRTSFSPTERNVVWLTINYENDCTYCMAAHTLIAKGERVDADVIAALRSGEALSDPRLEALRTFTRSVVVNRGHLPDGEVETLLAAGFTKRHVLDVLVGVSHKVLSNYTNHLADTPVDPNFEPFAWRKPQAASQTA